MGCESIYFGFSIYVETLHADPKIKFDCDKKSKLLGFWRPVVGGGGDYKKKKKNLINF
jgi:hypothetical protein